MVINYDFHHAPSHIFRSSEMGTLSMPQERKSKPHLTQAPLNHGGPDPLRSSWIFKVSFWGKIMVTRGFFYFYCDARYIHICSTTFDAEKISKNVSRCMHTDWLTVIVASCVSSQAYTPVNHPTKHLPLDCD